MDAQWVKHEKYVSCPFTLNAITWLNALGQWCEHSMSHLESSTKGILCR